MRPEAILAFDTSAAHCAAGLLLGHVVHLREEPMEKGQAERLMPMLAELLDYAGLGWAELTGLGVGIGPGNFTGVRISVAAARGLALGLGVPAVGVSTLEARAFGLPRPLWVAEDARRGEVYLQSFASDGDGPPRLVPLAAAQHELAGACVTGSAAPLLAGVTALPGALPLPEALVRLAALRLRSPQPRPAPLYLRAADAAPSSDPPPVILP